MPRKKKKHICAECHGLFSHGIGLRKHQRMTGHTGIQILEKGETLEFWKKQVGFKEKPPVPVKPAPPLPVVIDHRISPDLKAPYGTFAKVMVGLLLVVLVQTLYDFLPTGDGWTKSTQQAELRQIVDPTIRYVQGPKANYLVTPQLSHAQESIVGLLLEQTGREAITVTVHPTWPEYLGYSLWVCFALSVLWFFLTCVRGEWTLAYRAGFEITNLLYLASLFGAYSVAAFLGWVWHEPTTFGLMYLTLLSFAVFKDKIPASKVVG